MRPDRCRSVICVLVLLWIGVGGMACAGEDAAAPPQRPAAENISLPEPEYDGDISLEESIAGRRSRRSFTAEGLSLADVAQILWAAQGITDRAAGLRASPSAGATYPMEIYIAVGDETAGELGAGVYRYLPREHALELAFEGDVREQAATAALGQTFVARAPMVVLMAAEYARTAGRYGDRATRYVAMEAGHIGQNIYLQAEALGLGTVAVGAFQDEALGRTFRLPAAQEALYLMPVGHVD